MALAWTLGLCLLPRPRPSGLWAQAGSTVPAMAEGVEEMWPERQPGHRSRPGFWLSAPHGVHLSNKIGVWGGHLVGLHPRPLTLPNQSSDQLIDGSSVISNPPGKGRVAEPTYETSGQCLGMTESLGPGRAAQSWGRGRNPRGLRTRSNRPAGQESSASCEGFRAPGS